MVNRESILAFDKDSYEIEKKSGVFMLYSEKYGKWIKTAETGKDILFYMDGKRTVEEIIDAIAEEYEMPKRRIEQHVEDFCKHVCDIGFIGAEETSFDDELKHLHIDVTDACNLSCSYCNKCIKKMEENPSHMDLSGFRKVVAELGDRLTNKTTIHITGGEPLLNPNIVEILKEASEITPRIVLWSNGSEIRKDMAQKIKEYTMVVYLGIDSSNKEINDSLRGEGAFDAVMEAVKVLREMEIPYWFATTPAKESEKTIGDIVDLANEEDALGVYINQPIKMKEDGTRIENIFFDDIEEYISIEERLLSKAGVINSWRNNNEKKNSSFVVAPARFRCLNSVLNVYKKPSCAACSKELSVSEDGKFYPCSMLHLDKYQVKDLKEDQKKYLKKAEECTSCKYRMFCLGGCKAINLYEGKDLDDLNVLCEFTKRFFKTLLWG